MASTDKKKVKITETSKQANVDITSKTIHLPADSVDHVLVAKVPSAANCTSGVNVEVEMSPDGTNWCNALRKEVTSTGASSTTGNIIGNTDMVSLLPKSTSEKKNKHARGSLNFDNTGNGVSNFNSGTRDFMHQHIAKNKSFNYSQWFKTSEQPSSGADETVTFAVTVAGGVFYIDGSAQSTLTLKEGSTYTLDQSDSSNSGHPLRLSTTSNGSHGGGSEYTTGVTVVGTPGTSGAYTRIVVATGAPTLYYYCSNHSGMGGTANTPVNNTYKPVLFRHGGYDNFSNTKTVQLTDGPSSTSTGNAKYVRTPGNTPAEGMYSQTTFTNNKGWFPTYDDSTRSGGTVHWWTQTDSAISFWHKGDKTQSAHQIIMYQFYHDHGAPFQNTYDTWEGQFYIFFQSGKLYVQRANRDYQRTGSWAAGGWKSFEVGNANSTDWHHYVINIPQNASLYTAITNSTLSINAGNTTVGSTATQAGSYDPDSAALTVTHAGVLPRIPSTSTTPNNWSNVGTTQYSADIDELSTWRKSLTSQEISEIYNSGNHYDVTNSSCASYLERHIKCGDETGDGASLYDSVSGTAFLDSHDGTDVTYSLTSSDSIFVEATSKTTQNLCESVAQLNRYSVSVSNWNSHQNFDPTPMIKRLAPTKEWTCVVLGRGGDTTSGQDRFGRITWNAAGASGEYGYNIRGKIFEAEQRYGQNRVSSISSGIGYIASTSAASGSASGPYVAVGNRYASTAIVPYPLSGPLLQIWSNTYDESTHTRSLTLTIYNVNAATEVFSETHTASGSADMVSFWDGTNTTYNIDDIVQSTLGSYAQFYVNNIADLTILDTAISSSDHANYYQVIGGKIAPKDNSATSGVIAQYKFGDGPNDSVTGSLLAENIAVNADAAFVDLPMDSIIDNSTTTDVEFDGLYIEALKTADLFTTTSNLSISGWFKTTGTGILFSNSSSGTDGLLFDIQSSVYQLKFGSVSTIQAASSGIRDGEWHHLVVTKAAKDGSNLSETKIYIDGTLASTTSVGSTLADSDLKGSNGFTLLGDGENNAHATSPSDTDNSKLNATLSNWSLHSEVLDQYAVKQLYSNGHVRNIKNLPSVTASAIEAWWQLNNATSPEQDLAGSNSLIYSQAVLGNQKALQTSTSTTNFTRDFVSTTASSLFGGTSLPAYNGAWSLSFWVNIPSAGSSFDTLIGEADSLDTRKHFKVYSSGNYLQFSMTFAGNAIDFAIPFTSFGVWKHITITKASGEPTTTSITMYVDGSPVNSSTSSSAGGFNDNSPARGTADNWNTTNDSTITLGGHSWSYGTHNSYAGSRTGRVFKVDSLAGYSKELSSDEVETIYNSGAYLDPSTLASSFNVESCFKFGDYSNDVITGTIALYDGVGGVGVIGIGNSSDQSIISLTSSDPQFQNVAIVDLNTKLVNADGATYVNDSINGNGFTMSFTKSYNFTTDKWVSTADQDSALCLSFNGFEDQAEYFALWKCVQNPASGAINLLDNNWHNLTLSYRSVSSNSNADGNIVRFGPNGSSNYNWNISMDGEEMYNINSGLGADAIGGLNLLSSSNQGFVIEDRHLKYIDANSEEVYKPHAQFSAGVNEQTNQDSPYAFQAYVDETSFHTENWWVDQTGATVTPGTFNAEKPATIYGNSSTAPNRGEATDDYPAGVPYPLLNPEKLTSTGQLSDIEGTNQYVNPNKYDASLNPSGGLEGWWRWGDTPDDCQITINDAKDAAEGINTRDLVAFELSTSDVVAMTAQSDSIHNADETVSSGGGGAASVQYNQIKLEDLSTLIGTATCAVKDFVSPVFQYLRIKLTGSGTCDIGEGKLEIEVNHKKRRMK